MKRAEVAKHLWAKRPRPGERIIRELAYGYWCSPYHSFAEDFYRTRLEWEYAHAPNEWTQWLIQEVYW